MKRFILVILTMSVLIFSCQKGDTGANGPQGPAGPAGEDGYLVMQFQNGMFPSSFYTGTYDTRIANNTLSKLNFGSCSNIIFGNEISSIWRGLLKFDISEINQAAIVKSAYLTLYAHTINGSVDVEVYKVTKNWTEGAGNCGGTADVNASWDYFNGSSNAWTTPGGDYDLTTQSEVKTVTTTGYYTIKLNIQMVQDW
ncbi:MAG TPA: DNRLRE domain-containing protein, partial [Candidatus Goldiibacteriota bacterium]|nr:DNRLRE domain-containing protein [Candidatus Goldiibacteriota bacterium]